MARIEMEQNGCDSRWRGSESKRPKLKGIRRDENRNGIGQNRHDTESKRTRDAVVGDGLEKNRIEGEMS